jgi:imidazolonepropionase-like amidohydrolase
MQARLRLFWALCGVLYAPSDLAAQDSIVLRAGAVVDGRGGRSGPTDIVIRGRKIIRLRTPAGTPTYDLSSLTVLPGGIDTHIHLTNHFDDNGRAHGSQEAPEALQTTVLFGMENAWKTLQAGFTTVQSLGASLDRDLRDAVERGRVPGPRILTSLEWVVGDTTTPIDSLRARVRQRVADGADLVKIFASKSIREGGGPTLTEAQVKAACDEATALGRRSVVHAHAAEAVKRAARSGCTTVEHGGLADESALDAMAEHGTFFDPNVHLVLRNYLDHKARFLGIGNYTEDGFAHMERLVPVMVEVFRKSLARPKLKVLFGTDAVAGAHGRNWEELIYRVENVGQSPMDAIVSATSLAAASLRLEKELGTVAPGFEADLIATEGDPSREIGALRRVHFVMRGGTVYLNRP